MTGTPLQERARRPTQLKPLSNTASVASRSHQDCRQHRSLDQEEIICHLFSMAAILSGQLTKTCLKRTLGRRSVAVGVFRLNVRPNVGFSPTRRITQLSNTLAAPTVLATPETVPSVEESKGNLTFHGVHHVAVICANLERSLEFYQGVLDLQLNPDRPDHKLPYRGAWLWIGSEMIHLMELPNPDPVDKDKRPEHGGRDRHFCIGVHNLAALAEKLDKAGIMYTKSMSGRAAIFFRDPDANCLECVEMDVQGARDWAA